MSQTLSVKVSKQTRGTSTVWVGNATTPYGTKFKIEKADGSTKFATPGAVKTAANKHASNMGYTAQFSGSTTLNKAAKTTAKKAAKTTAKNARRS